MKGAALLLALVLSTSSLNAATAPWDRETFTAKLREIGERSYHDKHRFNVKMNAGSLSREAVRRAAAPARSCTDHFRSA